MFITHIIGTCSVSPQGTKFPDFCQNLKHALASNPPLNVPSQLDILCLSAFKKKKKKKFFCSSRRLKWSLACRECRYGSRFTTSCSCRVRIFVALSEMPGQPVSAAATFLACVYALPSLASLPSLRRSNASLCRYGQQTSCQLALLPRISCAG